MNRVSKVYFTEHHQNIYIGVYHFPYQKTSKVMVFFHKCESLTLDDLVEKIDVIFISVLLPYYQLIINIKWCVLWYPDLCFSLFLIISRAVLIGWSRKALWERKKWDNFMCLFQVPPTLKIFVWQEVWGVYNCSTPVKPFLILEREINYSKLIFFKLISLFC